MYFYFGITFLLIFCDHTSRGDADAAAALTSLTPYPVYKSQDTLSSRYVPHKTFIDRDVETDIYAYPSFDEHLSYQTSSSAVPVVQGPIRTALNLISKIGFYVVSGVTIVLLGGIFMTAVCSFTSICTITFNGSSSLDKDTMRAFMSPEKLATAAAIVQDAVGKYQRLQKSSNK